VIEERKARHSSEDIDTIGLSPNFSANRLKTNS